MFTSLFHFQDSSCIHYKKIISIHLSTFQHLLEPISKSVVSEKAVMPAEAGIQNTLKTLDSRLHGNDKERANDKKF
jgi:hypothetical protein